MKNGFQVGVLCFILGVIGVGFVGELEKSSTPLRPVAATANVSDLNVKMAGALSKRSLADHEVLYKIFAGLSDYVSNANRLDTTVDCYKAVDEVMVVYDVKSKFREIADIIDVQLSPLKTPAKLVDKKDDVIRLFKELADAVRYSADKLPKQKG